MLAGEILISQSFLVRGEGSANCINLLSTILLFDKRKVWVRNAENTERHEKTE